jgi:hypothetical protein
MDMKLLDARYDKTLDAVVFEAESGRGQCRGQMPVRDLILVVGRLLHPDSYVLEFHRAAEERFIDLRAYLTKSWTPWSPAGADSRFASQPPR